MQMMKACLGMIVVAGCWTQDPSTDSAEQAVQRPATVTRISVNGFSADTSLLDVDTNGFLDASKDQVANTSGLDFSYASPDPTNPDLVILIQGAGAIPNSAFTVTSTSAHLAVTTPFPVNRCVINHITGDFTCATTTPITFNLTWTKNGVGSVQEKTTRRETLGPVTTRFQGTFASFTANVNGTWGGHTSADQTGNLVDTQNTTIIREVTVLANP